MHAISIMAAIGTFALSPRTDGAATRFTLQKTNGGSGPWRFVRSSSSSSGGSSSRHNAEVKERKGAKGVRGKCDDDDASFIVGLNHQIALWDPCDPSDAACLAADLFERVYHSNRSAAAIAQLPQYKAWGFTGAGYDVPNEHKEVLPYMQLTMPLGGSAGPSCWHPVEKLHFPDPWDSTERSLLVGNVTAACNNNKPYRENLLGYIWTDTPAFDIARIQHQAGKDWVTTMRCLPAGAAGRTEYNRFLASGRKSPLATKNLLEDTDGLRRPPF